MALSEAKITIELREILLNDRPKNLYEISQKGTIPVLKINNLLLDESLDIMMWAIKKSNINWLDNDKNRQLNMINVNDTDFKYWLDRYKYYNRYPNFNKEYCKNRAIEILVTYEKILNSNNFLGGQNIGMVDIAIFPFIRQFCNVDSDWFMNEYHSLGKWLYQLMKSKLFNSVMNKYKQWDDECSPLIIKF